MFSTGTRTTTAHGTGGNNAIIRPCRSRYCISHRELTRTWGQPRSSPTPTTGQSITKKTRTTLSPSSSISIITSGAVRATLTLTSRTVRFADTLTCTTRMTRSWLNLSVALILNTIDTILSIAAPLTTYGYAGRSRIRGGHWCGNSKTPRFRPVVSFSFPQQISQR